MILIGSSKRCATYGKRFITYLLQAIYEFSVV